ncbi:MAG: hypothetical protein WEB53_03525 [Akkermansiaceae bacterium]
MTTIALELERTLERLAPEKARVLESRVREAISEVEKEKELPTLEEIKRRRPDLAHIIGAWADEDPDEPEELPMPPAKIW